MRTTGWLLLGMTGLVACGGENGDDRVDVILALEGDVAAGESVFAAECAVCHGDSGEGGSGPAMSEVVGGLDDAALIGVVVDGVGSMPDLSDLPDQDIADVTAYVLGTF